MWEKDILCEGWKGNKVSEEKGKEEKPNRVERGDERGTWCGEVKRGREGKTKEE